MDIQLQDVKSLMSFKLKVNDFLYGDEKKTPQIN